MWISKVLLQNVSCKMVYYQLTCLLSTVVQLLTVGGSTDHAWSEQFPSANDMILVGYK